MALFKNIHALLRKGQSSMYEDLLTEVFADMFNENDLFVGFIKEFLEIPLVNPQNVSIDTQKTFLKINTHDTDSRPDLVIQFRESDKKYIIFFENKVESQEGYTQLERYADHLKPYYDNGYITFLIYITRYDDPKDVNIIFRSGVTAKFVQLIRSIK
ncbi:PD-(D/E)XK nuclease family protein [Desulfosporosinus fructosivorans]